LGSRKQNRKKKINGLSHGAPFERSARRTFKSLTKKLMAFKHYCVTAIGDERKEWFEQSSVQFNQCNDPAEVIVSIQHGTKGAAEQAPIMAVKIRWQDIKDAIKTIGEEESKA
jgi:hypothetical protein